MMKYLLALMMITSLALAQQDEIVVVKIPTPGIDGIQSNFDVTEIKETGSPFMLNADVSRHPGMVRRRLGIRTIGANAKVVYGATGYYVPEKDWKMIVGVIDSTTINPIWVSTLAGFSLDSAISRGRYSGNRSSYGYIDFLPLNGAVVIADGFAPPIIVTALDSDSLAGSYTNDTIAYRPRTVDVEAPGQLRATRIWTSGVLNGVYEYRLHFYRPAAANVPNSYLGRYMKGGPGGVISNQVIATGNKVLLTLFDNNVYGDSASATQTSAIITRRKVYPGTSVTDSFYVVDTVRYTQTEEQIYIDNNTDADVYARGAVKEWTAYGYPAPGGIGSRHVDINFCKCALLYQTLHADSVAKDGLVYRYRFSYYDPTHGIESPLGPATYFDHWDAQISDTFPNFVQWPVIHRNRSEWIRLYRNVATTGIAGVGDTNVWYCIGQFRSNGKRDYLDINSSAQRLWATAGAPDSNTTRVFCGSYISDAELATGGITQAKATDYTASAVTCWSTNSYQGPGDHIFSQEVVLSEDGGALVRAPYVNGVNIPFADLEYANGRIWGIGDPLYKQRLYYTVADDPADWNALNYLSIFEDDNDELVALEKLSNGSDEVLVAFKHNKTFAVTGYDAEFDLSTSTISDNVGAVSRNAVVKANSSIYFASPNMKIYEMSQDGLVDIGAPAENWIDSVLISAVNAWTYVRAFKLGDNVIWFNTGSTKRGLQYNFTSKAWSVITLDTNVLPIGSFVYDNTTQGGFDENSDLLFQSDSAEAFRKAYYASTENWNASVDSNFVNARHFCFPFAYQTPYYGDGENLWNLQKAQLTVKGQSASYLMATVYVQDGDSVVIDSVYFDGRVSDNYTFTFPENQGKYVGVRFWTRPRLGLIGSPNLVAISDVTLYLRRRGNGTTP